MKEKWKKIAGFEGHYSVSDAGNVRSNKKITWNGKTNCVRKERIMIAKTQKKTGYKRVNLSLRGVKKSLSVHRIVAEAFIRNSKNLPTVNHKNGIKTDNNKSNLEWSTHSEQNKHAIKLGLKKVAGENHSQHKLTDEMVKSIRMRFKAGDCLARYIRTFLYHWQL
jgi:hypothetical protein